jgi:prolyl 4-hydroxylase
MLTMVLLRTVLKISRIDKALDDTGRCSTLLSDASASRTFITDNASMGVSGMVLRTLAVVLAATHLPCLAIAKSSQEPLADASNFDECLPHTYTTHLVSLSPLVIYIPSFLSTSEIAYLQSTPLSAFERSSVADSSGSQSSNATTRTSSSTSLSANSSPHIRCITERARQFQSLSLDPAHIEPLQLVKYGAGQQYHEHTDWFTSPSQATWEEHGGNRLTSFFAYVEVSDDIVGGGTRFPFLDAPGAERRGEGLGTGMFRDPAMGVGPPGAASATERSKREEEWCKWIDCDEPWENGLTFRPVEGSAVFWVNLLPTKGGKVRVGDERTVHAGLPVLRGRKMGMNIWTREGRMSGKYRGE